MIDATHHAPGATNTTTTGNPALCMTCHTLGQVAAGFAFADADQATPSTSGTSHHWNSGASGWVKLVSGSPGTVQSGGSFTGLYTKTYTVTITTGGAAGSARFNWTATTPGGGSGTNILTGSNVSLNGGVVQPATGVRPTRSITRGELERAGPPTVTTRTGQGSEPRGWAGSRGSFRLLRFRRRQLVPRRSFCYIAGR